jgi:hypothetical protein
MTKSSGLTASDAIAILIGVIGCLLIVAFPALALFAIVQMSAQLGLLSGLALITGSWAVRAAAVLLS